jgi:hypothetical protein
MGWSTHTTASGCDRGRSRSVKRYGACAGGSNILARERGRYAIRRYNNARQLQYCVSNERSRDRVGSANVTIGRWLQIDITRSLHQDRLCRIDKNVSSSTVGRDLDACALLQLLTITVSIHHPFIHSSKSSIPYTYHNAEATIDLQGISANVDSSTSQSNCITMQRNGLLTRNRQCRLKASSNVVVPASTAIKGQAQQTSSHSYIPQHWP